MLNILKDINRERVALEKRPYAVPEGSPLTPAAYRAVIAKIQEKRFVAMTEKCEYKFHHALLGIDGAISSGNWGSAP